MKNKLVKVFKISMISSIVLCILCPILYNIIGSRVLEDGTLDEPFYLVIFMFFFFILFIIFLVAYLVVKNKK